MRLLRAWLARLGALLRRPAWRMAAPVRSAAARHTPISSFLRRYPGRTPARDLRRNTGWVAIAAHRPDRDRRA